MQRGGREEVLQSSLGDVLQLSLEGVLQLSLEGVLQSSLEGVLQLSLGGVLHAVLQTSRKLSLQAMRNQRRRRKRSMGLPRLL